MAWESRKLQEKSPTITKAKTKKTAKLPHTPYSTPSDFEGIVEKVHVFGMESPVSHYLLHTRDGYYHIQTDGIEFVPEEKYQEYLGQRQELSRDPIYISNPKKASERLNRVIDQGWTMNLAVSNCEHFIRYVAIGGRRYREIEPQENATKAWIQD